MEWKDRTKFCLIKNNFIALVIKNGFRVFLENSHSQEYFQARFTRAIFQGSDESIDLFHFHCRCCENKLVTFDSVNPLQFYILSRLEINWRPNNRGFKYFTTQPVEGEAGVGVCIIFLICPLSSPSSSSVINNVAYPISLFSLILCVLSLSSSSDSLAHYYCCSLFHVFAPPSFPCFIKTVIILRLFPLSHSFFFNSTLGLRVWG